MNAHPNEFVEAWALKREHIEKTFRWTPKTLGIIALAGVAFPLWVYKVGVREFVRARAARQGGRGGAVAGLCGARVRSLKPNAL